MNPLRIIWHSLKTLYDELYHFLFMGFITLVALVLVLPGPLALSGLWGVAQRAAEGYSIQWHDYWSALKRYGPRNWLNTLIVGIIYGLLALNFWFYNTPGVAPISNELAVMATIFWLGMTLIWTGTVFYWLAFQLEMTEPKFWLSLRNSIFLVLARPLETLVLLVAVGLATALCLAIPPLLVFLPSFVALLSVTALKMLVRPLLEAHQQRSPASRSENPEP